MERSNDAVADEGSFIKEAITQNISNRIDISPVGHAHMFLL